MAIRIEAEWLRRRQTQAVFAALRAAGFEARAVGGAVRNGLIGKPASDIDFATAAPPEATLAAAVAAGLGVAETGLTHGTVTVIAEGAAFEVTTLRRDVETDGRHAVVAFTDDWAADASRRDFTINALYCDADGTVHDPLGGYDDLMARRVRFIGDAPTRIREDYLRILRFFRFTATYATGAPDRDGLAAAGALRAGLRHLSAERVRGEVLKILAAPRAGEMAAVMGDHGYWPALLGLVTRPQQLARMIAADERAGRNGDGVLRLAVLAVETVEDAARLAARLRLANGERDILQTVAAQARAAGIERMSSDDVTALVYRVGRVRAMAALRVAAARYGVDRDGQIALAARLQVPVLPLRGKDLLDLGVTAGPMVGSILRQVEAAWIASGFAMTREALLAQAEEMVRQASGRG